MGRVDKLGSMVREYPIEIGGEEAILYVRGMNVAEYIDLSVQGDLKVSETFFMRLAYSCIVGWKGIWIEDEDGNVTDEYSDEHLDSIPEDILLDAGKFIYYNLSDVGEEETQKVKGYIRFLFWSSEDDHKVYLDNFDCETCLKKGLAKKKNCSRFTDKQIDRQYKILNNKDVAPENEDDVEEIDIQEKISKYKRKKTFTSKKEAEEKKPGKAKSKDGKGVKLVNCNFDFPECPISWVDEGLKDLASIMYHCDQSNMTFFDGGLANQPYKFYKISKIVSGEASKIEREDMEKSRKDAERSR